MRILICGSRNWTDKARIRAIIQLLVQTYTNVIIIAGECIGVDLMTKSIALEMNLTYHGYPANWNAHGKAAGPIRNRQMLEEGKPDMIVAFSDDIANSKGTKNMLSISKKHPRYLVTSQQILEYTE